MNTKINEILQEIESVIVGKNEIVEKILMAILAQGHVLMEDVPGVGKTTTAMAFAKVLGLEDVYKRQKQKGYDVSKSAALTAFSDADKVSGYASEAMQWAVAEGLLQGSNGRLNPQGSATRAQVATILMRFMEKIAK